MDRDEQRNLIADPSWETALRDRARETITTLSALGVTSEGPVSFTVQDVPVTLTWTPREVRIQAGDDIYTWRMPLAWVTGSA